MDVSLFFSFVDLSFSLIITLISFPFIKRPFLSHSIFFSFSFSFCLPAHPLLTPPLFLLFHNLCCTPLASFLFSTLSFFCNLLLKLFFYHFLSKFYFFSLNFLLHFLPVQLFCSSLAFFSTIFFWSIHFLFPDPFPLLGSLRSFLRLPSCSFFMIWRLIC